MQGRAGFLAGFAHERGRVVRFNEPLSLGRRIGGQSTKYWATHLSRTGTPDIDQTYPAMSV